MKIGLFAAFVATVVAANWAAAQFGLLHVGFGLLVPAGTLFAGLAFVLRDQLQTRMGVRLVVAAILTGTAVSFVAAVLIGSPNPAVSAVRIALASGVAFLVSELADMAVYTPLRRRSSVAAMLSSNTAGSAVDTWLFLTLSGFGLSAPAFWGQLLTKAAWVSVPAVGFLWWLDRRAVARCAT